MTRYADRATCPSCHSQVGMADSACAQCGFPLVGPQADEVFGYLRAADHAIEQINTARALSAAAPAGAGSAADPAGLAPPSADVSAFPPPTGPPVGGTWAPYPQAPYPQGAPTPNRPRLPIRTVPAILVSVGALCLLIGGGIFLAVAWSVLGVAGRTAVLVAITVAFGALGVWAARRTLRAAAESLFVLALGLLSFDLLGAISSGWFGDLDLGGALLLIGSVVGVAAVAVTLALRPRMLLHGTQVVASIALMLATWGVTVMLDWPWSLAVAVVISLAVCALAGWPHLMTLGYGSLVVLGLWSLSLFVSTTDDIVSSSYDSLSSPGPDKITLSYIWGQGHGWPYLLLIAVLASLATFGWLPRWMRLLSATAAVAVPTMVILLPISDNSVTAIVATAIALGMTASAAAFWLHGHGPTHSWIVTSAPLLVGAVASMSTLVDHLATLAERLPGDWDSESLGARLSGPHTSAHPLMLVASVAMAGVVAVLILHLSAERATANEASQAARRLLDKLGIGPVATIVALTLIGVLASYDVPRWSVVSATAAVGLVMAGLALRTPAGPRRDVGAGTALGLGVLAGLGAIPNQVMFTCVVALITAVAVVVDLQRRREDDPIASDVACVVWLVSGAVLLTSGLDLAEVELRWIAVAGLLAAGAVAVVRRSAMVEVTGWLIAAIFVAIDEPDQAQLALRLTLLGALLAVAAIVRSDRRWLGWLAAASVTIAWWVGLADREVTTPEWYTLPVAIALLVFGGIQMVRTDRSTWQLLGPGLAVGLGPSLLIALGDPVSLRALLVGLTAVAILLTGVSRRWEAPTVIGASALTLLAVIEGINAQVLPQWWTLSLVGAALLAIGVTWEFWRAKALQTISWVTQMR